MIEEILDELKRLYRSEDLANRKLTEEERITLITKLETIAEIESMIKG